MKQVNLRKLTNKRILITGGTGSFGSTMLNELLNYTVKEIIIFSRDELKQFELRNKYNDKRINFIIGDIRDKEALLKAMEGVDYVFHAAALKQVPTNEFFPLEGIKTNILGANNVIAAAIEENVKKVILLSTDKAVYPINAMGMTKALMEKLMVASLYDIKRLKSKTEMCVVRYGNVMYSRGSVIPLFVSLIKNKKPLTITNPTMTRFMLPLSDSVKLVLHALTKGVSGSIYVKKAPAADIKTLAEALCKLFGYNKSIDIIGTRAGEKFHETLISKEEWLRVIDEGEFYRVPPEVLGLDYKTYYEKGKKIKDEIEEYTSANTKRLNVLETINLLKSLPEIKKELQLMRYGE